MTPSLPPGFVLDEAPALPAGFVLDGAPAQPAQQSAQVAQPGRPQTTPAQRVMQTIAMAGLRGAGDIGNTLLAIPQMIQRADRGQAQRPMADMRERGAGMDAAIDQTGVDRNSLLFQVPRVGVQVAGTAGVGGAAANVAARIPSLASRAPAFIDALRTSGMRAGQLTGPARLATQTAAGGIVGATAAGAVNPGDFAEGGAIGAVLPGGLRAFGAAGTAAGNFMRGGNQSPELAAAVQQARQAGYVMPPTQARPTLANRVIEGFSGKITTAQNASAKNQAVTNRLAAESLGLPADTKLTVEALDSVRAEAGKAYETLKSLPARPAVARDTLTNKPAVAAIDPPTMVFDLRKARNDATAWYRSYGRTADPDALAKAQAAKRKATELEQTLEGYAQSLGRNDLLPDLRTARTLIAKTHSVEDALNVATGSVDARRLAKQLDKGKPLSGELKQAAQFAAQFPKASQTVEGMGSLPQTSPLDWIPAGSLSAATGNPLMMLGVAARPAARAAALSGPVQNRLLQQPRGPAMNALMSPELQQLLLRSAPVAIPSSSR